MNLSLPGLALAQQLYVALMAQGKGRKGTQALILALASLSNVDWEADARLLPRRAAADRLAERAPLEPKPAAVARRREHAAAGRAGRGGGRSRASPRARAARSA